MTDLSRWTGDQRNEAEQEGPALTFNIGQGSMGHLPPE